MNTRDLLSMIVSAGMVTSLQAGITGVELSTVDFSNGFVNADGSILTEGQAEISAAWADANVITFRLWATVESPNDVVVAVAGSVSNHQNLILTSSTGFFLNSPMGTDLAPNPAFFSTDPTLAWDTFVTVGGATSSDFDPDNPFPFIIGPLNLDTGTNFGNVGWFVLPGDAQVVWDGVDGWRVLLGQFTIPRTGENHDPVFSGWVLIAGGGDLIYVPIGDPVPTPQLPSAPDPLIASNGTQPDYVLLTWPEVPEANRYQLWRSTIAGVPAPLGESNDGANWFIDDTAIPGTFYMYFVRARNGVGWGEFSVRDLGWINETSGATNPPATPMGLIASNGTNSTFVLATWLPSVDADTYEVWRMPATGGPLVFLGTSHNGARWYIDLVAQPGIIYNYFVRAQNAIGWSDFSDPNLGWLGTGAAMAPPCPGDVNSDGVVNSDDMVAILNAIGEPCGRSCPLDVAEPYGIINQADSEVVIQNLGCRQ